MSKDRSYSTAIHILSALAVQQPQSSASLALSLQTNPGLVRRVLSKLSQQGLVESSKGKHGGTRLAMPAQRITLDLVYLAVREGPIFGSFDKDPFKPCKVSCNMGNVLTDLYSDFEAGLIAKMKKVRLSEVVSAIG